MEALEFLQCYYAMCYHRHSPNGCGDCKAQEIDCELTTDYPERLVAIVEKWAKEHPEKPEQEQQKPEQERHEPEHPEESNDLHAIIDALEVVKEKTAAAEKDADNE